MESFSPEAPAFLMAWRSSSATRRAFGRSTGGREGPGAGAGASSEVDSESDILSILSTEAVLFAHMI